MGRGKSFTIFHEALLALREKNGAVWMDSHDASAFFPCSWSFMVDIHPPWGWCYYALMSKMELLGVGLL